MNTLINAPAALTGAVLNGFGTLPVVPLPSGGLLDPNFGLVALLVTNPASGSLFHNIAQNLEPLPPPEALNLRTAGTNNVSTLTSDKKVEAPTPTRPIRELVHNVRDAVLPNAADGPEVLPKNRPLLNVLKLNPLDQSAKKDSKDNASALGSDSDAPGKHRFGIGKTPVRDLVKRVLGGGDDDKDAARAEAAS